MHIGRLITALGFTVLAACGAASAMQEGNGDNPNQVSYWCPAGGEKFEPVATPFVVPAPPTGQTWVLLVLKAGDEHSTDVVNETFANPVVGQAYSRADGKGISHAILCYAPVTTSPPTTPPPTPPPTTPPPTTPPVINLVFEVAPFAYCGPDNLPLIEITFGNRPDLNGQQGVLSFSTGGSVFLVFQSSQTVQIPYPDTTQNVDLIYSLGQETETASVTFPEDCPPDVTEPPTTPPVTTIPTTPPTTGVTTSTVTSTTGPTTTTIPTSTTAPSTTTPSLPTTTTLPPTFTFSGAATVCISEVPTIQITFGNALPSLAGQTGVLTMHSVTGNVLLSTQNLVYAPGTTVSLLYPGTTVNANGTIADVPGWNLNSSGFWVPDSSDAFLRDGIRLTYTLNPTATATVTYPPESSACANPDGPFPPAPAPTTVPGPGGLPITK